MGRVAEEYAWCFAWCCEVSGGSLTACLSGAFAYLDAMCGCTGALSLLGIVD